MGANCGKTPRISRTFWVIAFGLATWGHSADAQPRAWDVDSLVERAINQPEIKESFRQRVQAVRAQQDARTVAHNPSFRVGYDHILGPRESREMELSVGIEHSFDLDSWRSRLRETLVFYESAVASEQVEWERGVAAMVREAFFRVRYHEERGRRFDEWLMRLDVGLKSLQLREKRGDVSRYDVIRVQGEWAAVRLSAANESMALAEAWAELKSWVPKESITAIVGPLAPDGVSRQRDRQENPTILRFRNESAALAKESKVWGSPFLRGWTIGAGYRLLDTADTTGHGVMVTLSLPLIFSDVDQPTIDGLVAQSQRMDQELQYFQVMANHTQQLAEERLTKSMEQLDAVESVMRGASISPLAEAAYQAGEISVNELLDAYGNEAERALLQVELQWTARRAALVRDRAYELGVPK